MRASRVLRGGRLCYFYWDYIFVELRNPSWAARAGLGASRVRARLGLARFEVGLRGVVVIRGMLVLSRSCRLSAERRGKKSGRDSSRGREEVVTPESKLTMPSLTVPMDPIVVRRCCARERITRSRPHRLTSTKQVEAEQRNCVAEDPAQYQPSPCTRFYFAVSPCQPGPFSNPS